jgi:hypothetical protein
MRSPELSGSHSKRQAGIPSFVESAPQLGHPAPPSLVDVLDNDPSGPQELDGEEEFLMKSGPRTVEPGEPSGAREILTGEPAADEIDGLDGLPLDGLDVFIAGHLRPMSGEYAAAVGIGFDHPPDLHSSPLETKIHAPDSREERADGQLHLSTSRALPWM